MAFRMGQQHNQRYAPRLLNYITEGRVDPSLAIIPQTALDNAPDVFEIVRRRPDACVRLVFRA